MMSGSMVRERVHDAFVKTNSVIPGRRIDIALNKLSLENKGFDETGALRRSIALNKNVPMEQKKTEDA